MTRFSPIYIRNFIFGVEDSLVSTVGLLSGVAVAGTPRETIVLTGTVLIFVEAFSMGVGSFLSENIVEESIKNESKKSFTASVIMFISYFFAGFIPLLPYLILPSIAAVKYSISFSLAALFILGIVSGKLFLVSPLKSGLRIFILGGIAIAVGVIVGRMLPQ